MAEMSKKQFEQTVRKEMEQIDFEQMAEFSRRCTLRALPYLCINGHLEFWRENKRQEHLYTILNTLDVLSFTDNLNLIWNINTSDAIQNGAIEASVHAYRNASTLASIAVISNIYSGSYILASTCALETLCYLLPSSKAAKLLLQDLQDVKTNASNTKPVIHDPKAWQNFKKALIDNDCKYWADLYEKIYQNGFAVDLKALEQRLNVPDEIKAEGAAAVGHYLEKIESQGAEQLNESRILILGDKGVGKTCLARKLLDIDAPMTGPEQSTPGVDTSIWSLPDNNMKVRIWDFAGHTVTHAVHQFFLSERCLYILVYNARTDDTSRLFYWLDHMKNYGGDSQAIILINEQDEHKAQIPENTLKNKYAVHSVHYLNIKTDKAKLESFRELISHVLTTNPCWNNQVIPKDYYQVKAELEEQFAQVEHITTGKFKGIADKYQINDHHILLQNLNALGIGLWYPDLAEFNTLVLNPEWISHGVYKIINYTANNNSSTVRLGEFGDIFTGDDMTRFNVSLYKFLYKLLCHYQLAYQADKSEALIIPHLLPIDEPDTLPSFDNIDSLAIKYKATNPLPPHTISRFIVHHHQQLQTKDGQPLAWRTGAILVYKGETVALVREDDRTISISVTGPDKTELISQLRKTFNDIFASFRSDKPRLLYKVVTNEQLSSNPTKYEGSAHKGLAQKPLWLNDITINVHIQDNRLYFDAHNRQKLDLKPTATLYNIKNTLDSTFSEIEVESPRVDFKHHICELQTSINELIAELKGQGDENTITKQINDLEVTVNMLAKAETCENAELLKRTGVIRRVKRILDDANCKNSALNRVIFSSSYGADILGDITIEYKPLYRFTYRSEHSTE